MRPVLFTVMLSERSVTVTVNPAGLEATRYSFSRAPPVLAGADQDIVAVPSPATARTDRGRERGPKGVTGCDVSGVDGPRVVTV